MNKYTTYPLSINDKKRAKIETFLDHLHYLRNAIVELYKSAYYENLPYPSKEILYVWRNNLITGDPVHSKWCTYSENKLIDSIIIKCKRAAKARKSFPPYDYTYDTISSFFVPANCLKKYKNAWVLYIPNLNRTHFVKVPPILQDNSAVDQIEIIQQEDLINYEASFINHRYTKK